MTIQILPLKGIPILKSEAEIWNSLKKSLTQAKVQDGDILVLAHTPFSRVRGPKFLLDEIEPSAEAYQLAEQTNKDPRKVEAILRLSHDIVKVGNNVIIARNKAGIICANAGLDSSNAGTGYVIGVPENPDGLATEVREFVMNELQKQVGVIISDTVGRALRIGAVNIAVGVSGIPIIRNYIGDQDLFGYELRVSQTAIADELASAAELVMGESNQGVPFVLIRGYEFKTPEHATAVDLNRDDANRLFR